MILTSEPSLVITPFLMLVDICSDLEDSVIVGNSINYLRTLRSWLSPVARSVNSAWKRCWHASVDGWAASTFHSRCDGKGPTVTIIRVGKHIFGGYTSISWGKLTLQKEYIILIQTATSFVLYLSRERKPFDKTSVYENTAKLLNFGFEMFVLVLQLQSNKINKPYQTQIRFKEENLFPGLSLVPMHLTGGLISKLTIRTNGANYTCFYV